MKNRFKSALLAILAVSISVLIILYFFNLRIVISPAEKLAFSPDYTTTDTLFSDISGTPRNIIVFIADGMGFAHLSLALHTQRSASIKPVWHSFDIKGWHNSREYSMPITDSGASATAIATGSSTNKGVIGLDHKGNRVRNIFEEAWERRYTTGIVTDSYIWDATPAAFVAHTDSRNNAREILEQMTASRLDVLFGELEDVGEGDIPDLPSTIDILKKRFYLLDHTLALQDNDTLHVPVAAVFDQGQVRDLSSSPNLPQLTKSALTYLNAQQKPFILLVESEEMDGASHGRNTARMIKGIQVIQETLALLLEFSEKDGQTLLLFTSDHETGGLALLSDDDNPDLEAFWPTSHHTASVVPLLASGPGAVYFSSVHRNWHIGTLLKNLITADTSENRQLPSRGHRD